jgi:putative ABC transport system substrate-binding protein
MRRRDLVVGLGATAAWPATMQAQQAGKVWRVGFVAGGARPVPFESGPYVGFRQGMHDLGYVEGENLVIEWRFAEGRYELFSEFAREFQRLRLDVIVSGLGRAVPAVRQANPETPVVIGYSIDPVAQGLVTSLARPGGNTTGLASALDEAVAKQLDLLATTVPRLSRVALLVNPANATNSPTLGGLETAAKLAGIDVLLLQARSIQDIDSTFGAIAAESIGALVVAVDAMFFSHRQHIARLALARRLPSMFGNREYVQAGGLMSYGESLQEFYRRAASYVHRILRGAKPAELPVERPSKFHLVINRRTADALGVTIPPLLYMFAEEVIE